MKPRQGWLRAAMLTLAMGGLADCAMERQFPSANLSPAPLPSFVPGDAFSFDDGRTERVVAVEGDIVRWSSGPDFTFSTHRDVLQPRLEWQSAAEHGERQLDAAPGAIWPLVTANSLRLRAKERVLDRSSGVTTDSIVDWSCRVAGAERIPTRAGTFDAFRVVCREDASAWAVLYAYQRTYFYAPAVRYYVRREDREFVGTTRVIELVGFRTAEPALTSQANAARRSAIQTTLESRLSGENGAWHDPNGVYAGTVEPLRTFRRAGGQYCRVYREQISDRQRFYRFEREACRSTGRSWQ